MVILFAIVPYAGPILVVKDELNKSDVCYAMGGNYQRLEKAIELFKDGYCLRLAFIGGKEGNAVAASEAKRQYAVNLGVSADSIVLDNTDIYSSYAELSVLNELILRELGAESKLLLITDNYHGRRTKLVASWVFEQPSSVRIRALPLSVGEISPFWWMTDETRTHVIREYIKLTYYLLRYKVRIPWISVQLEKYERVND